MRAKGGLGKLSRDTLIGTESCAIDSSNKRLTSGSHLHWYPIYETRLSLTNIVDTRFSKCLVAIESR